MFIGHFGVGFALKRVAPRTSLGTLMAASQLLDLLWPWFLLLGWERVRIELPGPAPAAALATAALARHFPAFAPRLTQSDRDRLLAARHFLSRSARAQRSALPFMHCAPDLARRCPAVLRHFVSHLRNLKVQGSCPGIHRRGTVRRARRLRHNLITCSGGVVSSAA
jgi:hypothetical protein